MAALDFTIVTRRIRTDQFVTDPMFFQSKLEHRLLVFLASGEAICELKAIIRLNTFDRDTMSFEPLYTTIYEICRRIGALFLVSV